MHGFWGAAVAVVWRVNAVPDVLLTVPFGRTRVTTGTLDLRGPGTRFRLASRPASCDRTRPRAYKSSMVAITSACSLSTRAAPALRYSTETGRRSVVA